VLGDRFGDADVALLEGPPDEDLSWGGGVGVGASFDDGMVEPEPSDQRSPLRLGEERNRKEEGEGREARRGMSAEEGKGIEDDRLRRGCGRRGEEIRKGISDQLS
jgi:hypothetical protein